MVYLSLWYGVSVFVVWCICICGMVYLSLWYGVSVFVVWCMCLCGMVYLSLWYGVSVFVIWCICICGMVYLYLWYGVSVFVVWCICLCDMVYLSLWYGVSVFVVWCICLFGMVYLSLWYGVSGTALSWFSSYLTDRQQRVKIVDCLSTSLPTSCGVPQGSVHGPFLFTLFTTPLSSVIQSHSLDTQIYISLATPDTNHSLNQLMDCLQDIFHSMNDNKLKLNTDET